MQLLEGGGGGRRGGGVMGYSESLQSYLNMTRKELQQLCKKHNIPANRSHAHLAKSLSSLCKQKKSFKSAFSEERTSSAPLISERKLTQENTQGTYESLISSEGDIHNQIQVVCPTTSEKPQIKISVVHPSTAKNTSSNSSTSVLGNLGANYPAAAGIRKSIATRLLDFAGNGFGKENESKRSSELGNANQFSQDAFTVSRACDNAAMRHGHDKALGCSIESGFGSANETSTKAPSFEFFVMSEDGLNLYVDLESNHIECINSMKDEVCIHQKGEFHESSAHTCGFPHADDNVENLPSADPGMELQSNEVEQNPGCTNSALSSVVNENGNSEAYPPDATIATSGSSFLISGNAPPYLGCSEENQVFSSSNFIQLPGENLTADMARGHGGVAFVHECSDASPRADKSNASLCDAPLIATSNVDDVTIDFPTKTTCGDYCHVEARALSNSSDHISFKNNLSDEVKNTLENYHFHSIKNQNGVVESLVSRSHMSEIPDKACTHGESSNLCQFTGDIVLDGSTTDAQSEVGTENDHFNQQAYGSSGTSVPDVPLYSPNNQMGCSTPTRGKDSGGARAESSLDNNCKRSNTSEILKELPAKRQKMYCENMNGTPTHKGTRSLTKETLSDVVINPRRSTRLVPK